MWEYLQSANTLNMVGCNWPAGKDIVFCLDRIQDIRLSSQTFESPEEFDPQEYFDGCIGESDSQSNQQE